MVAVAQRRALATGLQPTLNATQAMPTEILPGDWWFIRQQRIPLHPESPKASNSTNTTVSTEEVNQPDGVGPSVAMHELSEKAARICFRLHSLHLAGVRHYLTELQAVEENLVLTDQDREWLREKLDFGKGKEWTSRFKKEPDRWTLDFVYKFGVLRNVLEPAPPLLDWASTMTWLTMSQSSTSGGSLPLDYLLYSVCAIELCSKLNSLDSKWQFTSFPPEHIKWVAQFSSWQVRALTHAWWYLSVPRPLLNQCDKNNLRWMLSHEPAVFFKRAISCSDRIREALIGWGVQL